MHGSRVSESWSVADLFEEVMEFLDVEDIVKADIPIIGYVGLSCGFLFITWYLRL